MNIVSNKKVVELGSGTGYGSFRLAEKAKRIVAVDIDRKAIDMSKEKHYKLRNNIQYVHSSIENYSTKQTFDIAISLQVIEHLKDPEILVGKAYGLLRKGGVFIISTPNRLTQSYNENPYHIREFSSFELRKILNKFFSSVTLYGLFGDKIIEKHERLRKLYVTDILNRDILKIRRLIPRKLRQYVFDIASTMNRHDLNQKNLQIQEITEQNYHLNKKNISESLDIIAVCKK